MDEALALLVPVGEAHPWPARTLTWQERDEIAWIGMMGDAPEETIREGLQESRAARIPAPAPSFADDELSQWDHRLEPSPKG